MTDEDKDRFANAKITKIEIDLEKVEFTFWFDHTGTEPFDKSEFSEGSDIYERLDYLEEKLRAAVRLAEQELG